MPPRSVLPELTPELEVRENLQPLKMSKAEWKEASEAGELSYYKQSKADRLGEDWFVLQAWTPSAATSAIMLGNDLISQQHLDRLKASVRQAVNAMQPVRAIQRVRFDGVTLPAELRAGEFWWYRQVMGGGRYGSYPSGLEQIRGARPPLGAATWCYQEVRRPATSVRIKWNITPAEVSSLFQYWNYSSILVQNKNYTGVIDETRGAKAERHALTHSQLTLVLWVELAEWIKTTERELDKAAELTYSKSGYSVRSISVDAGDLAPLTKHEASALCRRPLLRRLLQDATGNICDEFANLVYDIWHGNQRRAERRLKEAEEAAKELAEQLERERELEADDEEDEHMDDTLITEEGSTI